MKEQQSKVYMMNKPYLEFHKTKHFIISSDLMSGGSQVLLERRKKSEIYLFCLPPSALSGYNSRVKISFGRQRQQALLLVSQLNCAKMQTRLFQRL